MADVVIGYGHGSNTWESGGGKGVRKNGKVYEEHTANVRLGEKVIKILEAHGISVALTQPAMKNDVSLNDRFAIVRKHNPKVWIELHHNAGVPSASGSCVFAWKHNSPSSNKLQKDILDSFKKAGIDLHGDGEHDSTYNSWTNLFVTRNSQNLSGAVVLIENGFMTNPKDFEDIFGNNREEASTKKAVAIAKGVLKYLGIEYVSSDTKKLTLEKLGEVRLLTAMNYREEPSLEADIIKVLPKGHECHFYDVKGHWLRLGYAGWVSNAGGKYVEITKRYDKQPKEPAQKIYRVIVDGEQVGAYAENSNILEQIKQAMPHLEEDIIIQEV